jgi:hypothetical protein
MVKGLLFLSLRIYRQMADLTEVATDEPPVVSEPFLDATIVEDGER